MKKSFIILMLVFLTICLFVGCKEVEPKATYSVYEGFPSGARRFIIISSDGSAYFTGIPSDNPSNYWVFKGSNGSYSNGDTTITVNGNTLTHSNFGEFTKVEGSCVVTFDNEEKLTLTINNVTIFSNVPKYSD